MENITINGIEQCESKAGKPYWKVQTSAGQCSCFEKDIVEKLIMGKTFELDIQESADGKFKNIRKIGKEVKADEFPVEKPGEVKSEHDVTSKNQYPKDPVGLAVEIYNGNRGGTPEKCIELVKTFQKAF